jgi:hypothetical protein
LYFQVLSTLRPEHALRHTGQATSCASGCRRSAVGLQPRGRSRCIKAPHLRSANVSSILVAVDSAQSQLDCMYHKKQRPQCAELLSNHPGHAVPWDASLFTTMNNAFKHCEVSRRPGALMWPLAIRMRRTNSVSHALNETEYHRACVGYEKLTQMPVSAG